MARKNRQISQIPQFALYGEETPSHALEFVHIEDIHERSSRNGWVIKPHRHMHLFQILCMRSGEMDMRLDDTTQKLSGSWVVAIPPGVVHGFRFRPDTQGVVLSIAVNLQGLDAENQVARLLEGVLEQARPLRLRKNCAEHRQLLQQLEQLQQELALQRADQGIALFALVKLVLVNLRRQLRQTRAPASLAQPGIQLNDRFRHLLEQHYREHWAIADYASALHVSVSTLNRACQELAGQSAKKLLQERLHVEARRRLMYTFETLDQIAWNLGYKDAAYFSRVFKSHEGLPPHAYRKAAQHTGAATRQPA